MNVRLKNAKIARTFLDKFFGLMGTRKENFNFQLVFELRAPARWGASIHMLFVRFPLDVFWLDRGKKVVDLRRNVKPWTLSVSPRGKAKYIVEVECGKVRAKIGDKIAW